MGESIVFLFLGWYTYRHVQPGVSLKSFKEVSFPHPGRQNWVVSYYPKFCKCMSQKFRFLEGFAEYRLNLHFAMNLWHVVKNKINISNAP